MEFNKEEKKKFIERRIDKYGQAFFGMVHNNLTQREMGGLLKETYLVEYEALLHKYIQTELLLDKMREDFTEDLKPKTKEKPKREF